MRWICVDTPTVSTTRSTRLPVSGTPWLKHTRWVLSLKFTEEFLLLFGDTKHAGARQRTHTIRSKLRSIDYIIWLNTKESGWSSELSAVLKKLITIIIILLASRNSNNNSRQSPHHVASGKASERATLARERKAFPSQCMPEDSPESENKPQQ